MILDSGRLFEAARLVSKSAGGSAKQQARPLAEVEARAPTLVSLLSEQAASAGMAAAGAAKDPQSLSQKCGSDPVLESTFGSRFGRLRQTQALP